MAVGPADLLVADEPAHVGDARHPHQREALVHRAGRDDAPADADQGAGRPDRGGAVAVHLRLPDLVAPEPRLVLQVGVERAELAALPAHPVAVALADRQRPLRVGGDDGPPVGVFHRRAHRPATSHAGREADEYARPDRASDVGAAQGRVQLRAAGHPVGGGE